MPFLVLINLAVFAILIVVIARFRRPDYTLSRQILIGLITGVAFGYALQALYSDNPDVFQGTLVWTNLVGSSYMNLLRMIIMPLVLVMMIAAVVRMRELGALGKIGGAVIGILVGTTMIAALVGIAMANLFGLTAEGLTEGARELAAAGAILADRATVEDLGLADTILRFIPSNVFYDLTGARPTSVIAVVIFGILFGVAALLVIAEDPEKGRAIESFVETLQAIIMKLVHMIMALTPFGIMALMTKVVAGSSWASILNLATFIVASFAAIAIMFGVQATLLKLSGVRTLDYFKKAWPVLAFAFTSRSSAASIPLSVETQVEELNVPVPVANLSATFGSMIGQNGCAGIYPAMLAVMVAPGMGVDPFGPTFIVGLVAIIAISSFGIAGVGGGGTFAALVVLPSLGFPIAIVALLISIEPLIDMARTALNVNGAMTAGVLTSKIMSR
jgi:uncharacterized protein